MDCKNKLYLFLLCSFQCCGQLRPTTESILSTPDFYQQRFVTEFLRTGNLEGFIDGFPKDTDHNNDFRLLVRYRDWVLPMVEKRLKEWLSEPEVNKAVIDHVSYTIQYVATVQTFDVLARVYANRPELRKWIRGTINNSYGSAEPNFITTWYHALEHSDLEVQEIAKETMLSLTEPPRKQGEIFYRTWGIAIINRRGHEPTTSEIQQDPILELFRLGKSEAVEIVSQKITKVAKEEFETRKKMVPFKAR